MVAVVVVVGVDEGHIVASHHAAAPAAVLSKAFGDLPALRNAFRAFSKGPFFGQLRHRSVVHARRRHSPRTLSLHSLPVCVGILARFVAPVIHPVLHVKGAAVAPAAAHAHAVGFIELPVAAAVIALQEGFLHPFYRQIQAPVLPVDGDIHIAAQRGVHSKLAHHLVGTLSTLVVA